MGGLPVKAWPLDPVNGGLTEGAGSPGTYAAVGSG